MKIRFNTRCKRRFDDSTSSSLYSSRTKAYVHYTLETNVLQHTQSNGGNMFNSNRWLCENFYALETS